MKAAHTPGPWAVLPEEHDRPYIRVRGTQLGGRYKVANVAGPGYEGAHQREADETRANAQLIAAVPNLFDVAKLIEPLIPDLIATGLLTAEQTDSIRAAISKATGRAV